MRILGIDLGDKRTGLAVADQETGTVMPVAVLEIPRGPLLVDAIIELIREHEPARLLMGLPLNMDDSEGDRAGICRTFGDSLEAASGLEVSYQDERLSSDEANRRMAGSGRTQAAKASSLKTTWLAEGPQGPENAYFYPKCEIQTLVVAGLACMAPRWAMSL